jgi:hypothetical protein
MEIPKSFNKPPQADKLPSPEQTLPSDIRESLYAYCDGRGLKVACLSLKEIANRLIAAPGMIPAVKAYLWPGGEGYESDSERADGISEKLAWTLAEEAILLIR